MSCSVNSRDRARASETFAIDKLGLHDELCLRKETQLIHEYRGCPIPEGIWRDPSDPGKIVSVEVKRVIGNRLPMEKNTGRRRVTRRSKIVWPWSKTVEDAVLKSTSRVLKDYNVHTHYAVFIVPEEMSPKNSDDVRRHIWTVANDAMKRTCVKIKVKIFDGPIDLFDRLD